MWLCHGWGWQPPQTASHIHMRHDQSVWAHWYAVHRHMVAALHSYTHSTWLRFLGSGSLVESKYVIMSWLKLTATLIASHIHIRHITSVWAHWYVVHVHTVSALHNDIPTLLGSDFWDLGHLWSQNDVIMSWLWLTATSNCFLVPYNTYAKCLSTLICCP